jgi:hypothetical protein
MEAVSFARSVEAAVYEEQVYRRSPSARRLV